MNENGTMAEVDDDEIEIDVGGIFRALLHWLWLILIVGVAAGLVGYSIARFVLPKEYESTTSIYVLDRNNGDSTTYSDLQVSSQLTADYRELIKSRYVIEKVIQDLNLDQEGYTFESLSGAIEVTSPDNTHILVVTVTDTDPQRAQAICNDVREVAAEHIQNVMKIDAVNVVDEANLPDEMSAPSYSRWTVGGAVIGILVVAIVIIVRFIADDTIKTTEDVERYLHLYTLAVIPMDETVAENSVEGKSQARRKKRRKKSSFSSARSGSGEGHRRSSQGSSARNSAPKRGNPSPAAAVSPVGKKKTEISPALAPSEPGPEDNGSQDDYITIE
ncbi:MAG: YveK family protein [Lachnospiraceae bacterium]